jgi:hypothetical protein
MPCTPSVRVVLASIQGEVSPDADDPSVLDATVAAMLTIVLSLSTALSYALQDYLMMPAARAASVIAGVLWVRVVAVLVLLAALAVVGEMPSGGEEWRAAGFAALGGAFEVAAFIAWLTHSVAASSRWSRRSARSRAPSRCSSSS